jgi:hypothetical protein
VQDSLKAFKKLENNWKQGLKETEFRFVEWIIKNERYDVFLSKEPRKNWIRETLKEQKKTSKFEQCKNLVMVGSGIYPYSMVDIHKRYPNINIIGLDYDEKCVKISNHLIEKCNLHKSIKIIYINGIDFDYSILEHEDLVFLSIDVVGIDEIYNKVLETSKAQPYVCAPGKHAWFKNTFGNYLRG